MALTPVWRLVAHHEFPQDAVRLSKKHRRIAIGWGAIGDLRKVGVGEPSDVSGHITNIYPTLQNAPHGGASLWNLYHHVGEGDLVIIKAGRRRELVMRVTGPYYWQPRCDPKLGDYQHQRKAEQVGIDADGLWQRAGADCAPGENMYWTLFRCLQDVRI